MVFVQPLAALQSIAEGYGLPTKRYLPTAAFEYKGVVNVNEWLYVPVKINGAAAGNDKENPVPKGIAVVVFVTAVQF